jgi:hypothetical protein
MIRLTLALALWISLVSVASASLTARKELPTVGNVVGPGRAAKFGVDARDQATKLSTRSEFVLTEQTEILLNGKPCGYDQVPADARIVRMELAADQKTVRAIHFRTWK